MWILYTNSLHFYSKCIIFIVPCTRSFFFRVSRQNLLCIYLLPLNTTCPQYFFVQSSTIVYKTLVLYSTGIFEVKLAMWLKAKTWKYIIASRWSFFITTLMKVISFRFVPDKHRIRPFLQFMWMLQFDCRFWRDDGEENISCCLERNSGHQARSNSLYVTPVIKPAATHYM
jgi:hypothetical protein